MKADPLALLPQVVEIAKSAGALIHPYFYSQNFTVTKKMDNTLLTNADLVANDYIVSELKKISDLSILSEEGTEFSWALRQTWSTYWLVDPLDGTRGFVNNSPEFTVNIALIQKNQPILGVIFVPEKNVTYYAVKNNLSYKQIGEEKPIPIQSRAMSENVEVLVGQHYNARRMELLSKFFLNLKITRVNSSLKFCLIAEGLHDFYLRVGPICEWDTAAGHCILEAAGGVVVDFEGQALQYNVRESLNCPPFIAMGDKNAAPRVVEMYNKIRNSL